jgi:1-acyl-sn-glycerol-3-phosphate acyltransferase
MTVPGKTNAPFFAPATGSIFFQRFCKMFFHLYCRLTVTGQHNLPVSPFIICSNHTSHIDSAALMTASGLPFSTFALLGASDYFFDSGSTKFLVSRFMNVIPINRHAQHQSLQRSMAMCRDFLTRSQGNLILYPEGTRSCNGGLQPFKKGAGMFAVDLGVPVVPAYIEGAHRILPKGNFVPRPGSVTVRFGEPVLFATGHFDPRLGRGPRRAAVELLERRIRALSESTSNSDAARSPEAQKQSAIAVSVAGEDRNAQSRKPRSVAQLD